MAVSASMCTSYSPPLTCSAQLNKSHKDTDKDGRVMADQLENPEMKMYFRFLELILSPLCDFNTAFQVCGFTSFAINVNLSFE
jgi:hypothetical protein